MHYRSLSGAHKGAVTIVMPSKLSAETLGLLLLLSIKLVLEELSGSRQEATQHHLSTQECGSSL